jgi:hypothetical protein
LTDAISTCGKTIRQDFSQDLLFTINMKTAIDGDSQQITKESWLKGHSENQQTCDQASKLNLLELISNYLPIPT